MHLVIWSERGGGRAGRAGGKHNSDGLYNERQIFSSALLFEFHNSGSRLVAFSSGTFSGFKHVHIIHATSAAPPPRFQ